MDVHRLVFSVVLWGPFSKLRDDNARRIIVLNVLVKRTSIVEKALYVLTKEMEAIS